MRLGMINNPSAAVSTETSRVARAIWAAMQTQSANNAKNFITKLAKEETAAALEEGADIGDFAVGVREDMIQNDQLPSVVTVEISALIRLCDFISSHPSSFINCLQVIYFLLRVWMCHCSRMRTMGPNLTSCSPTLPTAETCSN